MQIVDYKLDNNEKLKALRLDIMAYFDPASDQNHKVSVLKIVKLIL